MEELTEEQEQELLDLLGDDELSEDELTKKIEALPYADAANKYLLALFMIPSQGADRPSSDAAT